MRLRMATPLICRALIYFVPTDTLLAFRTTTIDFASLAFSTTLLRAVPRYYYLAISFAQVSSFRSPFSTFHFISSFHFIITNSFHFAHSFLYFIISFPFRHFLYFIIDYYFIIIVIAHVGSRLPIISLQLFHAFECPGHYYSRAEYAI
jgi:hypothetical protein